MQIIKRTNYLDKLIAFKDKKLIKVITGIRRCGKSTLMEIFQSYLHEQGITQEQIVSLNFEDYDYYDLREPRNLHAYLKDRLIPGRMTYIFLDEVQHVKDFPDVVDSFYIKPDVDIYLTGSNAHMLSSEIATLLSGRYVEIPMLPLSFKEFMDGQEANASLTPKYSEYISIGSFPYAMQLEREAEVNDYLTGIYNTIILKDVIARKKINDAMMLESVVCFTADKIGNMLSTKRIADIMTAEGRKIDQKTVERYLSALRETFVLYPASRYNIRGKQFLKTLEKYYFIDMGLRRVLLGNRAFDAGRILENVIYLELLRRHKKVYVGKMDNLEVDFVTMDEDGLTYYQVAATVRDEHTLQRELASLKLIRDQYPKLILTLDEDPDADYDGIKRRNALQWLMEGK